MNIRKYASVLGFAIAIGTPLAVLAGGIWETTHDEAGSRIINPQFGSTYMGAMHSGAMGAGAMHTGVTPLQPGAVSADRQYVFLGDEGGWQLRPMEYRLEGGRLVHVDDPVGHMHRLADNSPLTAQLRESLERSGGT